MLEFPDAEWGSERNAISTRCDYFRSIAQNMDVSFHVKTETLNHRDTESRSIFVFLSQCLCDSVVQKELTIIAIF